jgi:hypothetical protein
MTPQENNKQLADAFRALADRIDPTLNPVSKPPKAETTEAAQDAHQAALTAFQTLRQHGMNLSLNGLPMTEADIEKLKEKPKS